MSELTAAAYRIERNRPGQTETCRAESSRTESSRTESSRAEHNRAEHNRAEDDITETSRTEGNRTENDIAETSRTECNQAEDDIAEANRTERNRAGDDIAETSRTERNRAEDNRTEALAARKQKIKTAGMIVINLLISFLILLPLFYAFSIAFMRAGDLFTMEFNLIPKHPTWENFRQALIRVPLLRFVLNSFITAGFITFGQVISCSLAAFSFSFLNFKGKNILFMLVMSTMMVPGEATIISNYLTVGGWGWLDSYRVLIIPYLTSAMGIFLFRQFYLSFPISLYESAKIDGCTDLRFIFKILLPLTKSAVGAMAVYTFINAWNMYMWPLLVTGSDQMRTVQIGIGMLDSVDSESITLMMAGVVMIIIPSVSVFILGQKQLIRGMFSGAVKG